MTEEKDYQKIKEAVEARKRDEEKALKLDAKDPITPQFIHECFDANARGDGALFAAIHKKKFVFSKAQQRWFIWDGHHWAHDSMEFSFIFIEKVAEKYLIEAEKLTEEIKAALSVEKKDLASSLKAQAGKLRRRVMRLRDEGAQKCLTWAHRVEDGLGICGDEFDRDPWLLACRNGVIELRTGRFRPGRPEDFLEKAAPHDWVDVYHKAPSFEKFLDVVFEGNQEIISFVQRLFGYGLTGLTNEHIFALLYGEGGRNGKGTLVETLQYVLGPLAKPVQSEMLLDQRNARSASAPSPDIMSLFGARMVFASETDEGRRFSTSKIKWLSGGDTLVGRNPNDKFETIFSPTHLLCLLTNHLPHAPSDDYAFWARILLVPFNVRFVDNPTASNERPKINDLAEKLKGEAPGILAWLVRGCLEWQRQGLNPPTAVRIAAEKYQFNEDILANFLSERCEISSDARVKFGVIYVDFTAWFETTIGDIRFCPRKKKFGLLLEKKFKKEYKSGQVWFCGLELKPEDDM